MAQLIFRLTGSFLRFSAEEKSEEWAFSLNGKCVPSNWRKTSFTVISGKNSWNGHGADVTVTIKNRPSRSEVQGIPESKPFDKDDGDRDTIHVTCSESGEQPFFQIVVLLPPDVYQRLRDVDWTKESVDLIVANTLRGDHLGTKGLIMGADLDGRETEWHVDIREYEYLESVTFHFSSGLTQKVSIEEQPPQDNILAEKTLTAIEQTLTAVERAIFSIGEFRASTMKAAWILAAVLVVTAFIR